MFLSQEEDTDRSYILDLIQTYEINGPAHPRTQLMAQNVQVLMPSAPTGRPAFPR